MNLLVTNSQEIQAYVILRSLRQDATRVVITMGGDSVGSDGFPGMAAYSRFVDARYQVPHFAGDWLAGRLAAGNTEAEEAYIRRIEEICRRERVDVIFPSLDPEVYLFAKNKERLAAQGILVVVPEPAVIRVPMDKALTIQAAQRVGFPCPRTWFPGTVAEVEQIARTSGPPWIVKPRFTAHAANMVYVDDAAGLPAAFATVSRAQQSPLVQEYLQGGLRRNYYVIVGRDGSLLSALTPKVDRTHRTGFRVSSKSAVSASDDPHLPALGALLKELGLWGGYTIQTQVDPRDGLPKLLEINARLGQHLWWRTGLGVNEPRILLQLARGERPGGNLRFPDGVRLLDPFHDVFVLLDQVLEATFGALGRLARRNGGDTGADWGQVRETLGRYRRDYLNRQRKVLCPEVSNLLVDPCPCLRSFWFKARPRIRYVGRRVARPFRKPALAADGPLR